MIKWILKFAWDFHDWRRAALSFSLGVVAGVICWEWIGLAGKVSFLLAGYWP
jgi:hypothetical protein